MHPCRLQTVVCSLQQVFFCTSTEIHRTMNYITSLNNEQNANTNKDSHKWKVFCPIIHRTICDISPYHWLSLLRTYRVLRWTLRNAWTPEWEVAMTGSNSFIALRLLKMRDLYRQCPLLEHAQTTRTRDLYRWRGWESRVPFPTASASRRPQIYKGLVPDPISSEESGAHTYSKI